LHGVSVGVPFVFTGFDWKDAATKLNLVTCFQIATNQTQAPATANGGRARLDFKTFMRFIVTVLASSLSQLQRRCGFRFVQMVKTKRL
jgi:hypothetical protein